MKQGNCIPKLQNEDDTLSLNQYEMFKIELNDTLSFNMMSFLNYL